MTAPAAPDLKLFALLAELGDDERELVADMLERFDLDEGEQLFAEGQEAEGLYFVERGTLELRSQRAGSLGRAAAGEALGCISLVAVGPREATAVAADEARVWLLSRESFRRLAYDSPRAACRILEAALADFAGAVRDELDRFAGPRSRA
jgi:CRP-like cAMP-binding protein